MVFINFLIIRSPKWNLSQLIVDHFQWTFNFSSAPPAGPSQPGENPTFTLFYFNVKALAEPVRYLFAYGAQEYEDVRVTRDEWPALKPSLYMQMKSIFVCSLLLFRISIIVWK